MQAQRLAVKLPELLALGIRETVRKMLQQKIRDKGVRILTGFP